MTEKAVVLGANYYIGLSVIRCLGRQGVHVTAVDYRPRRAYAFSSRYCREKLVAPDYKTEPRAFVDFLLDYGHRQEQPPVLMPTADPYAQLIDANLNALKQVYLIPTRQQDYLSQIIDKASLQSLCQKHGVHIPEEYEPNDLDAVEYPCLVKPADSHAFVRAFRVKMFMVKDRAELDRALERARAHNLPVVIQRIIPGFDDHVCTYDAYLDQRGKVSHWTTCQKLRQYPINFGASVYTRHKVIPELHEIGSKFLEAIGYRGFAEIEFKYDPGRKRWYLIEINVRFSSLNVLLNRVGLNFPWIMYRDLTGEPLPPKAITESTNIRFRYLLEDVYAMRDYLRQGQLNAWQLLKSEFARKAPAVWDWGDPLPAFTWTKLTTGNITGKLRRRIVKNGD
ncbi:MAG: carboxylate--amine ligase [Firmicutes bacterium]|nr:carboxylate--amine ligase [Bacillota bacterium]